MSINAEHPEQRPLRLIIADDHPMLVDGLKRVLEEMDGIEVLDPVSNGWQLIDRLWRSPADIVLLDLHMPQLDGIATLKRLRKDFPRVKVIVFTNYGQMKLVKEIKLLGAQGYLLKNSTSVVLKEAVAAIAAGGTWFHDETPAKPVPEHFIDDFMQKYQLTKRETEIIRMISKGFTSREIAENLLISEFTINAHRRNICRKLQIYTPVGLLNFAKEHGLA